MEITERKNRLQDWISGNIISDQHSLFMIGYDNLSHKYRLIDLEKGIIMNNDYNTIDDLILDNSDYYPITHAEILYTE